MGKPGRDALRDGLPIIRETFKPLFIIVNGENAAHGVGITPDMADEFFDRGIDAITLGNHAFHKREILSYLDRGSAIIRPINLPPGASGRGKCTVKKGGIELNIINVCGRVFMEPYDDPFRAMDAILPECSSPHILVDIHAETTSEKIAMAWYLDGRVTAVIGTHTHVQTADERIMPKGTAAITDVGMTGPQNGILGMNRDIIIRRFLTSMPERFEVADGEGVISGLVLDVNKDTGRVIHVERLNLEP